MNEKRFQNLMTSVDDDLLEEAQAPQKHPTIWLRFAAGAVAACICFAVVSAVLHTQNQSGVQIANPVRQVTSSDVAALGYSLPLPADAQDAVYSTVDSLDSSGPMAQVTFQSGGQKYICRALKSVNSRDISGISANWTENLAWKTDALELRLQKSSVDNTAWVGWFSPQDQTQWCLSGSGSGGLSLLHTAQTIMDQLGYDIEVAPKGAEDVAYSAFLLDGLTVAETTFRLDGVHYAYRVASTSDVGDNFADISGLKEKYKTSSQEKVGWCPARLSYNEGGSGKIVWFDVVPGLLYSLSMDSGASKTALLDMAGQLYTPAQGDVG